MPFQTDGGVHETVDASTTSFESSGSTKTYSTEEEDRTAGVGVADGDSSDEVDPRRLMSDPHIDDIRWLYRTSLGQTLIDKPIDDAFKNGFEVQGETERTDVKKILDKTGFEESYKLAQKKARRDGFALLFLKLEDNSTGIEEDPFNDRIAVKSVKKLQVLTIDDLSKYRSEHSIPSGKLADTIPFEEGTYEIRKTGMVVDMDPNSDSYKEPLGYLVGQDKARRGEQVDFIHANRIFHYTWNPEVDGDLDEKTLGEWEGDSVLVSVYHLLRGMKKGNWSIMQTLFRYAAKLYHVALPEDADEDDQEEAQKQLQNLNAKGEVITPHGYEMEDFQTDGQLQPREYFDVIFDQICASLEMTKSVLFGTQTGVVSGSETDIKNYFNQVQRLRQSRIEGDIREFVIRYNRLIDGRTSENYKAEFEIEWGPLFKLSDLDQAETLTRTMQTLATAINNFVMTPMEARSILQEEWAEADIDWNDEFTQEEKDFLKTLNIAQMGTEAALPDQEGSTQQQNGGGMKQGQQTASEQPSTDAMLPDRVIDQIAQKVMQRMGEM